MFAFIDKVCNQVSSKFGAPMGRNNVGTEPVTVIRGCNGRICKCDQIKVYDRPLPMVDGGYDKGGAYWGLGKKMRVRFTKDFSFIQYYRAK